MLDAGAMEVPWSWRFSLADVLEDVLDRQASWPPCAVNVARGCDLDRQGVAWPGIAGGDALARWSRSTSSGISVVVK
jgi:hypothetical protein